MALLPASLKHFHKSHWCMVILYSWSTSVISWATRWRTSNPTQRASLGLSASLEYLPPRTQASIEPQHPFPDYLKHAPLLLLAHEIKPNSSITAGSL